MRLIDADALKEIFLQDRCGDNFLPKHFVISTIDNAPTFSRPQGEYRSNDKISPWGNPGRSCSLCGKIVEFSENYCPKCGARMIKKE